jgi:hypothetical protein
LYQKEVDGDDGGDIDGSESGILNGCERLRGAAEKEDENEKDGEEGRTANAWGMKKCAESRAVILVCHTK